MCHYITITLAGAYDLEKVNTLAKPFSIRLVQVDNRSVTKFMEPDEGYFYTTTGHCDCGTDLCARQKETERAKGVYEQFVRKEKKYRQKGWSEAKIERWRVQQEDMIRRQHGGKPKKPAPGRDCIRYTDFFNTLFEQTNVQKAGFLLHFYGGGISTEKIELQGRVTFRRNQLTPRTLFSADEDTLNIFLKR